MCVPRVHVVVIYCCRIICVPRIHAAIYCCGSECESQRLILESLIFQVATAINASTDEGAKGTLYDATRKDNQYESLSKI